MPKIKEEKSITFTARLEQSVYDKVVKKSAKDNRSRNYIINEHLKTIK